MAGVDAPPLDPPSQGPVAEAAPSGRRKWLRWIVVAVTVAIAAATCATRGLSPWEVEARIADVVRSHPDSTKRELARAIATEFSDDDPAYSGSDGAAFSRVRESGIAGSPIVRRLPGDGTVRVAVVYAEAPVIPTGWGDMYCLVIDVPVDGASHRTRVEGDFTRPDHCARAHLVAPPP